jgi:DNA-binding response OmpR family regulator
LFFAELGATDYLVKPIRMQECRALAQKMRHRKQPSAQLATPE